jgi:16S rRNA (uracil1498-N3)-methyltransferase
VERESPLVITLLQGVARGERMDLILQKATELGVAGIVPVLAERSVVRVGTEQRARKLEHWQAVAIAACEQCGRNRVPQVSAPVALGDAIAALSPGSRRCLLAADGPEPLAAATRGGVREVALLIGPEGGLADNERKFAAANGFEAFRMGPRILRTETAGLAALAALQSLGGDFSI